jgi:hypothetical protein
VEPWVVIKTTLLVLTFGFVFSVLAYAEFADRKGWPAGEWFRDHTSFPYILAGLAVPFSAIAAVVLVSWAAGIIVVVGGFLWASLRHEPSMQLARMDDVAGCRLIFKSTSCAATRSAGRPERSERWKKGLGARSP